VRRLAFGAAWASIFKARPLSGDANSRRGARVCVVEVEAAVTPEAATSVLSCSLVCTMASSS
jgi:hypothetical protein